MTEPRCENCAYFVLPAHYDRNVAGQCRRFPPIGGDVTRRTWPPVYVSEWCGEFSRRVSDSLGG